MVQSLLNTPLTVQYPLHLYFLAYSIEISSEILPILVTYSPVDIENPDQHPVKEIIEGIPNTDDLVLVNIIQIATTRRGNIQAYYISRLVLLSQSVNIFSLRSSGKYYVTEGRI